MYSLQDYFTPFSLLQIFYLYPLKVCYFLKDYYAPFSPSQIFSLLLFSFVRELQVSPLWINFPIPNHHLKDEDQNLKSRYHCQPQVFSIGINNNSIHLSARLDGSISIVLVAWGRLGQQEYRSNNIGIKRYFKLCQDRFQNQVRLVNLFLLTTINNFLSCRERIELRPFYFFYCFFQNSNSPSSDIQEGFHHNLTWQLLVSKPIGKMPRQFRRQLGMVLT